MYVVSFELTLVVRKKVFYFTIVLKCYAARAKDRAELLRGESLVAQKRTKGDFVQSPLRFNTINMKMFFYLNAFSPVISIPRMSK